MEMTVAEWFVSLHYTSGHLWVRSLLCISSALYYAVTECLLSPPSSHLSSLLPSLPPTLPFLPLSPSLSPPPSLSPYISPPPSLPLPFTLFLSPLFLSPFLPLPSFFPLPPPFLPLHPLPLTLFLPLPLLPSHHQVMEELKMLKARNPFTPILFVTLNLPTSDERAMEIEDRLIQDLNSIGYLSEDASVLPPEVHYPAQSPQVSSTAVSQ